jgi:hypothetical protein
MGVNGQSRSNWGSGHDAKPPTGWLTNCRSLPRSDRLPLDGPATLLPTRVWLSKWTLGHKGVVCDRCDTARHISLLIELLVREPVSDMNILETK